MDNQLADNYDDYDSFDYCPDCGMDFCVCDYDEDDEDDDWDDAFWYSDEEMGGYESDIPYQPSLGTRLWNKLTFWLWSIWSWRPRKRDEVPF